MATSNARLATNTLLPGFLNVNDWKLRNKLIFAFVAVVTLTVAIFGVVGLPRISDAMLQQGSGTLIADSDNTAHAIDQYMTDKLEDIVAASKLPNVITYATNQSDSNFLAATQALTALAARTDYQSIAIILPSGKVGASSSGADLGTNLASRDYFLEAMKGTPYISDPSVSVVTNQPAIFFTAPIQDSTNKIIGVIRSRLAMDGIWALVEKDKNVAGPGTFGTLLDENGIRLATSLSQGNRDAVNQSLLYTAVMPVPADIEKALVDDKRFGNAATTNIRVLALPEVGTALKTPGIKTFETTADNSTERHYASISTMTSKPWHYVLMTPLSTFTGAADSMRFFLVVLLVISGVLAGLVSILVARTITNPINKLTQVADRISLGELDAKIDINRKDEIGELAESVGRMQASLQAAIERLRARRTT